MANNNQKKKKNAIKSQNSKEVILLKLVILVVVFAIPLIFMILDVSRNFSNLGLLNISQLDQTNLNKAKEPGDDFNFAAPLPAEQMGDIANVSQEKIDSLFDNLKE